MSRPHPLICLALLGLSLNTAAQPQAPIKPGLWEMRTLRSEIDGKPMPNPAQMQAQMQAQMAQMPPEMRKQMQERMRAQGIDLSGGSLRTCISAEMLRENAWAAQQQGRCKIEVTERGASQWRWRGSCQDPASEMLGQTSFRGSEGYQSETEVRTQHQGRRQVMKMAMEGRWLGADCGGLAPMRMPRQ